MSHTLKLYSRQRCPFAHRTRIALLEKGLAYEHVEIDLNDKPADFLIISPYGKVPVLLHDETRVYESAIINEYLDETFPDPPLMPKSPAERAYARVWIDFASSRLSHALRMLQVGSESEQVSAREELGRHLTTLNKELVGKTWLGGDAFSLVECTYAPSLGRLEKRGIDFSPHAALDAWWKRIATRPSFVASL